MIDLIMAGLAGGIMVLWICSPCVRWLDRQAAARHKQLMQITDAHVKLVLELIKENKK